MKLELMKNYRKKQYVIVDTDNDDEVIIRFYKECNNWEFANNCLLLLTKDN